MPYMSIHLLCYLHSVSKEQEKSLKMMMMEQTTADDLELYFSIFVK